MRASRSSPLTEARPPTRDGLVLWVWPNDAEWENADGCQAARHGVDGLNAADPVTAPRGGAGPPLSTGCSERAQRRWDPRRSNHRSGATAPITALNDNGLAEQVEPDEHREYDPARAGAAGNATRRRCRTSRPSRSTRRRPASPSPAGPVPSRPHARPTATAGTNNQRGLSHRDHRTRGGELGRPTRNDDRTGCPGWRPARATVAPSRNSPTTVPLSCCSTETGQIPTAAPPTSLEHPARDPAVAARRRGNRETRQAGRPGGDRRTGPAGRGSRPRYRTSRRPDGPTTRSRRPAAMTRRPRRRRGRR